MKKVKVQVIKTYYKTSEVELELPDHIDSGDFDAVDLYIDSKSTELSDALANASLNADMDGIDIENWELIKND